MANVKINVNISKRPMSKFDLVGPLKLNESVFTHAYIIIVDRMVLTVD